MTSCFFITESQEKAYAAIKQLLGSKLDIDRSKPRKFIDSAFVTEKLKFHFKDGRPDFVSFDGYSLGTFTLQKQSESDVGYPINHGKIKEFERVLQDFSNFYCLVSAWHDGCFGCTEVKAHARDTFIGNFSTEIE